MPQITRTIETKHTIKNNHYMRLYNDAMGIFHLEIGFNGDYHDKKSSYNIDVNAYDLKQFVRMINAYIIEMEK